MFGGAGIGPCDDAGVRDGETCGVGEVVAVPLPLAVHPVAIVISATSHRTDLPLRLDHSFKGANGSKAKKVSWRTVAPRVANSDQ